MAKSNVLLPPVDPPAFLKDDNFWEMYGDGTNFVEITCDDTPTLIEDILTHYGVPFDSTVGYGGPLQNLDIKQMDALTVINLALIDGSSKKNKILEWTVDENGDFRIIEIGHNGGSLSPIYYELQTGNYKEPCVGVMITGAKPRINPKPLTWEYIWGDSKQVYDTSQIITNCAMEEFSTNAIIVYNDPHLDSKYEDGINNFYELSAENPYDVIVGYVRALSVPGFNKKQLIDTEINVHNTSVVPIIVTGSKDGGTVVNLGEALIERPSAPDDPTTASDDTCWSNSGQDLVDFDQGVKIPLSSDFIYTDLRSTEVSKYISVEAVYVVAYKFDSLQSIPSSPENSRLTPSAGNSDVVGAIKDVIPNTYKLEQGVDYVIAYDMTEENETKKEPWIVFAKNTRPNEPHKFGTNQDFYLRPGCQLAQTKYGEGFHTESILPVAGNKGFLVKQVIAMVQIDTPSVSVYDPEWNDAPGAVKTKAIDIANALEYKMAAIVMEEYPPPIAFCSGSTADILSQSDSKVDSDPTTKQNFIDTPLEEAMEIMANGPGITLSLSFIEDEDELKNLAETIFKHMSSSNDPIETTYICGPDASPELGAKGNYDGIINSINYSYTDSGSYTISVTEGSWLVGNLTSINTSTNIKMAETVSARATVIEGLGNNIFFKVKIDGYGNRTAINTAPNIIRKGDVVQCTVYNNPVEA